MKDIRKIKLLDYIRTTDGELAQVVGIDSEYINTEIGNFTKDSIEDFNSVLAALLKPGDYVNGSRLYLHAGSLSLNGSVLHDNKIVQVITKEKFYRSCYTPKVGNQSIEWRKIENFPLYQVSNTGSVMVTKTGKYMSYAPDRKTLSVRLESVDGRRLRKSVAVLVLEAFVEKANGRIPMFIDGDENNCNLSNLRWETKQEQAKRVLTPQKTRSYNFKYKWVVGYYEGKPVIYAEHSRALINWLNMNCDEYRSMGSNHFTRSIVSGVPYRGILYKCVPYEEYIDIIKTVKLDNFKELSRKIHETESFQKANKKAKEQKLEVKSEKVKEEKKVLVNDRATNDKETTNKEVKTRNTTLDDIDDSEFYKEQERVEKIKREKFKRELLKRLQGG